MTNVATATRTTARPAALTRPAVPARLGYRPDVDGLRALAVVLVVAFHAGVGWVPGGFVGVDVFFVISGFLITGLLVDELDRTGTVSLTGFYARRIRRLLPLSALVLVTTAVACAVILPPLAHQAVADDIRSAALWVSNWRFAAESTQYMADTQQSPILHYWTLSLEEQFYVVWPLIILLVARTATRWGALARRRLVAALGAVFVVSLLGSMVLTQSAGPWAYFGLHTRAWELAAGAALALGAHRLRHVPLPVAGLVGWGGVGLIVYAAVTVSRATPFPGVAAVMPVTGTVLVLAAGARTRGRGTAGLLGLPAFVYVGRISYGWYLWHWPLLVLAGVMATMGVDDAESDGGTATPVGYVLMAVLLSFALAAISHRFVEDPVRRSSWFAAHRHRSLALGAALTALSILVAFAALGSPDQHAVAATGAGADSATHWASAATTAPPMTRSSMATGIPSPQATATAPAAMTPAQARADAWPATDCFVGFAQTRAPSGCRFGAPHGRTVVALIGDSHAAQWLPAMDRLAKERGWQLWFWAKSACPMTDV
ncbi:MAG: acyltransferase family protein, partial [Actinomycetes bacterium]